MKKIAMLISLKRSIEVHLHRLETFLLYFYDAYEVNLWEKTYSRRTPFFTSLTNYFNQSSNIPVVMQPFSETP